ncbi:MAG: hypothetical protein JWO20_856 [Candidatus Angelobacter sp.]|jgi:hypothetical protein|nr:hypothetical protein [Candidatus Angelobacter sp.]
MTLKFAARKAVLFVGALALTTPPVNANQFYVSPAGSDLNPGTDTRPFRTIQTAANIVNPGDVVIVEDGTYSNATQSGVGSSLVNVARSGTRENYITFKARHRWSAVLDGLSNNTAEGWAFSGSYIRVKDFEIKNFSDDAFSNYRGGQYIEIAGNHIHDIGRYCTDTKIGRDGVFISNGNVIIEKNLMHDIGRFSPGEKGCAPSTTTYQNNDHGIYISGGANNATIRNNIFYDISHGWSIHVYPDPVNNLSILNNTFAFPNPAYTGHIVLAAPATNSRIENNIFYQPNTAAIYFDPAGGTVPADNTLSIKNNISSNKISQLWARLSQQSSMDANMPGVIYSNNKENTDPQLVSPSTHDFHLRSGSPAIGFGAAQNGIVDDFDGLSRHAAPSVGACEISR